MGGLADELVNSDPNFRKARLPALYSDFRPQRTLNPDGYRANLSAWRHALSYLTAQGLISQRGSAPDLFVLTLDETLLRSLETKQYGQPLALGTVVREAAAEKEFVPLADFNSAQQSIYQRSWAGVPWGVMSWTLRQIGVIDPARGDDKLPQGRFVVIKNVEAAAKALEELTQDRTSRFDRIYTRAQFKEQFSSKLLEGSRLSDTDLEVFLKFLSRDKGRIEYDGETVRIKGSGEQSGIPEEDSAIAALKELTQSLEHQTALLNTRIDELSLAAKDAVARKNRISALAALKAKKAAEASLASRYQSLQQVREVAARIQQAADNVQLVRVMEASTGVLQGLNAQIGGPDRVDSVMDHLREQMGAADEVSAILAESAGAVVDEGEIDDELAAMEAQERAKEEEAERKVAEAQQAREAEEALKKLEELPPVPSEAEMLRAKAQTPTSETGIANLSMEEKPLEEREEPLPAS